MPANCYVVSEPVIAWNCSRLFLSIIWNNYLMNCSKLAYLACSTIPQFLTSHLWHESDQHYKHIGVLRTDNYSLWNPCLAATELYKSVCVHLLLCRGKSWHIMMSIWCFHSRWHTESTCYNNFPSFIWFINLFNTCPCCETVLWTCCSILVPSVRLDKLLEL